MCNFFSHFLILSFKYTADKSVIFVSNYSILTGYQQSFLKKLRMEIEKINASVRKYIGKMDFVGLGYNEFFFSKKKSNKKQY